MTLKTRKMALVEKKGCPCGGTPRLVFWGEDWMVKCESCRLRVAGFDFPEDAIESFYRVVKTKKGKNHPEVEGRG